MSIIPSHIKICFHLDCECLNIFSYNSNLHVNQIILLKRNTGSYSLHMQRVDLFYITFSYFFSIFQRKCAHIFCREKYFFMDRLGRTFSFPKDLINLVFATVNLIPLVSYKAAGNNPSASLCLSKSPNQLNQFHVKSEKLPAALLQVQKNIVKARLQNQDKLLFIRQVFIYYVGRACINPFLANVPVLYPLKTPGNQKLSCIFRGYKMGTLARNV